MGLPNDKDIYKRLIVLKYVVAHAFSTPPRDKLQEIMKKWSAQEKKEFEMESHKKSSEMIFNMKKLGVYSAASPKERKFLNSNIINMDSYEQIASTWRIECILMLMWALNYLKEFPSIEEQAEPELLKKINNEKISLFYKGPKLRDRKEIFKARDLIESWHWRSRTRQLIETEKNFKLPPEMVSQGLNSLDDVIRLSAKDGYETGYLKEIKDEDYVVEGIPFRDLSRDKWSCVNSIIMERHYALNWLCGYAPRNKWDETPIDT